MIKIVIQVLDVLFNVAAGIFLLRLLLNEINPSPFNGAVGLLHRITEPVLSPIRKILPIGLTDKLYIDISPLIVFLLIIAIKLFAIKVLAFLFLRPEARPARLISK